jgi:hypothetical protein
MAISINALIDRRLYVFPRRRITQGQRTVRSLMLKVMLSYAAGTSYYGNVTMTYDASRGVFTYRLPAV